jgi:hypothetical protein
MTRRRLAALLIVAVPVVAITVEWLVRPILNPLRRSPGTIAASLLEQTQPGSTRAEVSGWVDAQGWRAGGKPYPFGGEVPVQRIVGEYDSFGFDVIVCAEWIFDKDGRLETVEVYKWVANAP